MSVIPPPRYKYGNIIIEDEENSSSRDPFPLEKFDVDYWRGWMGANFHIPLLTAITYLVLVGVGRRVMASRQPFHLTRILILWNVGFALFSLLAFLRTAPDLIQALVKPRGFHMSVCSSEGQSYPYAFWSWLGTLSKVAELGDTAFLILRKSPLIFLHWYHHATAMLYTWYIFEDQEPCHRWLMTMNYLIHILMYSYFALRGGGVWVPRGIAMLITTLQILQMFMGVYINYYTWRVLVVDGKEGCDRSERNLILASFMYASYLILFLHFFYNSYFKKGRRVVKKVD